TAFTPCGNTSPRATLRRDDMPRDLSAIHTPWKHDPGPASGAGTFPQRVVLMRVGQEVQKMLWRMTAAAISTACRKQSVKFGSLTRGSVGDHVRTGER